MKDMTEMNEFTRQRLRSAFREAFESRYSDFYRNLYAGDRTAIGPDFPRNSSEWKALPYLTKEDLVATPYGDRLFVPFAEAGSIRVSSGTSGRGIVLIPRNFHVDRSYFREKFTKMLCFYTPHFGMDEACRVLGLGHIGADPANLPATAEMARLFGIDALAGACSPILAFLPHLKKHMDGAGILYIHLWGERPSEAQFQELDAAFPNAEITWEYSNIETGGQSARPCPTLEALRDDRVHPLRNSHYWELLDPQSGATIDEVDVEGEIVLTTLWSKNAIPAIRYRTGDLAKRVAASCLCEETETFQILGRVLYDRAIIAGGELKSEELERVLVPYAQTIENNFELHITHLSGNLPSLTLYIKPRSADVSLEAIAQHVADTLRITASRTLSDAVREGLIAPLLSALMPEHDKKVRRIVRNL